MFGWLFVYCMFFSRVFWFVPCFFIDVNSICAIGATYQNGYDWTGHRHWPLRTKIEALEVWVGHTVAGDVTDDVMQNIVTTLIFERNHSWNQTGISSIFEVCLCLGNNCQLDDFTRWCCVNFIRLRSFAGENIPDCHHHRAPVRFQRCSAEAEGQLGSDGVLGWLRYVSSKAQVGFWQIRNFFISYD